jgi:DNA-binding MarR family transcriptional regulator
MAETQESQQNLGAIRTEIEQIRAMQRFQIAASPDCRLHIEKQFKAKIGSAEVYLTLCDGLLSLDDIMAKTKKSKPWVSKVCTYLHEKGLIARVPDPHNSRSILFTWTDLEAMFGASDIAQKLVKNANAKAN